MASGSLRVLQQRLSQLVKHLHENRIQSSFRKTMYFLHLVSSKVSSAQPMTLSRSVGVGIEKFGAIDFVLAQIWGSPRRSIDYRYRGIEAGSSSRLR